MPLWKPESADVRPEEQALRWSVYEVSRGGEDECTRHVVCWCGEGRTSSRIQDWNSETRIATTRSGRRYHLIKDAEGFNLDAEYVFKRWCTINKVTEITDVSKEYQ